MFGRFFQRRSADQSQPLHDLQTKVDLKDTLEKAISGVLDSATHRHENSDSLEDVDSTYKNLEVLRSLLRQHMGIAAQDDLFADLKKLTNEGNVKKFVNALVTEGVIPIDNNVHLLISQIQEGNLSQVVEAAKKNIQQSLFGYMQTLQATNPEKARRAVYDEVGHHFSRVDVDTGERVLDRDRVNGVQEMLNREFGGRGAGITSGDSGLIMMQNILNAKTSIDIGMFQMEHSTMLGALHAQQQMGVKLNMMLNPSNETGDMNRVGFSWMNQASKNLLGDSVSFDPDVQSGDARYAHQKFIAVDLDSADYRDAAIMIGSFNMTRGALGQILDRAGNLVRQNPHNLELGLNINYGLVTQHGLKDVVFQKIRQEAIDYRNWLFDRTKNSRVQPLGYTPEHILTGRQTYDKIQKALGVGSHATSNPSKVDAFFMLNVITDRGMDGINDADGNPRGLYHDIEEALRANKDSRVTIFVTKGFKGIRSSDLGKEDAETSRALEMLRKLENDQSLMGRFRLVEVEQHIHAKTAMVFRNGHLDVISGSTNVSSTAMGGWSQEVSMAVSTRDFDDGRGGWLVNQANNVLNYMWTIAARPSKRNPIADVSHAHHEKIRMELQRRLNPALSRLINVEPIMGENGQPVGSMVQLSASIKDPRTGRMIEIKNAMQFQVLQHFDDPDRIYLPDLEKIIDPVLAQAKTDIVKKGRGGRRGELKAIEVGPSGVIAAAAEHIVDQMNQAGLALLAGPGSRMSDARLEPLFRRQMIKIAGERFRDTMKNFEGLPVGEHGSDARKFKRLVYGLVMRDMNVFKDPLLAKLAQMYSGNPRASQAPVLSMNSDLKPMLDPMSIEASFNDIAFWDMAFDTLSHEVRPNAPNQVLRAVGGEIKQMPLHFTVLAQSLSHDAPANLFLAEGFKYLTGTDFNEETAGVQFFMNGAKLDQLAQRVQNMLGIDISRVRTTAGTSSENSLKTVVSRIGPSGDYNPETGETKKRTGTRLNMLLVFGLNEQTLMQADVFRGGEVSRKKNIKFDITSEKLVNSADFSSFDFFDGQVRFNENGELVVRDKDGNYVKPEDGKPLIEIGADEKQIRGITFWNGSKQQVLAQSNPIYGIQGARISVNNIRIETRGRKTQIILETDKIDPINSSMRLLSQGIKQVPTFLGSFLTGKRGADGRPETRSLFTDYVEGINQAISGHSNEEARFESGNLSMSLGTVGSFYDSTFRALGMSNQDGSLDVKNLHGLVGESIVKSGVALLHTGYALLTDDHWATEFLSIFQDKNKFKEFQTMLARLQKQTDLGKKLAKNQSTDLQKMFLLEGIDRILAGDGFMQESIVEALSKSEDQRQHFVDRIMEIREGNLEVVTQMSDKLVVAAAAAYHVIQSIKHGELLRDDMMKTTNRLGGKPDALNVPNLMWDVFIPLTFVENFSVTMSMSSRESAMFHRNYTGHHSQTVLRTLSFSPESQNRSRMVAELMGIGYLGGTAVRVANEVTLRQKVGKGARDLNKSTITSENAMYAGIHFQPLAYIGPGMDTPEINNAFIKMSQLVQQITYGKVDSGGKNVDLSEAELDAIKKEFYTELDVIKNNMSAGSSVSDKTSPMMNEHYIQAFKLMSDARIGAPTIQVPIYRFRALNEYTYQIVAAGDYEYLSLPSPDAVKTLQTFDDHMGEMLKLSHEILRGNLAVRKVMNALATKSKTISNETRLEYEEWMSKVERLRNKIREAASTDIQKAMTSLTGVRGFAAIANTIGNFDSLKFESESQKNKELAIDNVIIVGDDMYMSFMNESMQALNQAREAMRSAAVGKVEQVVKSVAEKGAIHIEGIDKVISHSLKLSGKLIYKKGQVRLGGSQHLSLSEYLLNAQDNLSGGLGGDNTVGRILSFIQVNYNQARETRSLISLVDAIQKDDSRLDSIREELTKAQDILSYKGHFSEADIIDAFKITSLKDLENTVKGLKDQAKRVQLSQERKLANLHAGLGIHGIDTNSKTIDELRSSAKQVHAQAMAMNDIFALKIQQEILKSSLTTAERSSHANPIAKAKIMEAMGAVTEKLNVLGMGMEHIDTVERRLLEIQSQMASATNIADQKRLGKLANFFEAQLERIRGGVTYTTNELMGSATLKDIQHAFGAAGINLMTMIGDTVAPLGSFSDEASADKLISSMQKMFNAQSLANLLRDSQQVRQADIAIAAQRAGAPVGPQGPASFILKNIREANNAFQAIGTSYRLDVQMNRRSAFLHLTGMALNLGDFDGDNVILATMKRYTLLKTIQAAMGDDGLAALERSYNERVENLRHLDPNDRAYIAATELLSPLKEGSSTERIGMKAELEQIEETVHRKHGDLIIDMTEAYMGMSKGTIESMTKDMFAAHWADADNHENSQARKLALKSRVAVSMNKFAEDMYSSIYQEAEKSLRAAGVTDVTLLTDDQLQKALEDGSFNDAMRQWYKQAATGMVGKALNHMFGSEMGIDDVLKYGVKVAFASTKLIGNWTNTQTLMQTLNSANKLATYANMRTLEEDVKRAAEHSGNTDDIQKMLQEFHILKEKELKKADIVERRLSAYMLQLQQATRDAIKEKALSSTHKRQDRSAFESMLTDNPFMRAIDTAYALVNGKSIFNNAEIGEMFNRERDVFKHLASIDIASGLEIVLTNSHGGESNDVIAGFTDAFMEQHGDAISHVLLPQLEAAAKIQEKWADYTSKAATMDSRARMRYLMHEAGLGSEAITDAVLMTATMTKNIENYDMYNEYKKAVFKEEASDFEKTRSYMDEKLKLVFLNEQLRGGKMTQVALDRVMTDIVQHYVTPTMDTLALEEDARSIDPSGSFAGTLRTMVQSYFQGEDISTMFSKVYRQNTRHYQLLAEFEYKLAEIVEQNPLVEVSSSDADQDPHRGESFIKKTSPSKERLNIIKEQQRDAKHTIQHNYITGIVGGLLLGAGSIVGNSESASAAQMFAGPTRQDAGETGQSNQKLIQYAADMLLTWHNRALFNSIEQAEFTDEQKIFSGVGLLTAMTAGELASERAAKVFGPKAAALVSLATMAGVGHLMSGLTEELQRVKDANSNNGFFRGINIKDDIDLQLAIEAQIEDIDERSFISGDEAAIIMTEDGPIPGFENVTEGDISNGISTPEGDGIIPQSGGTMDSYNKPEFFSRTRRIAEAADRPGMERPTYRREGGLTPAQNDVIERIKPYR